MALSPNPTVRLLGRRLTVALLCLTVTLPAFVLAPPPEPARANVCDAPLIGTGCEVGGWVGSKIGGGADLITDSAGVLTGGAKGVAGVIAGEVGKAVGKAIEAGTKGVFDQLTQWVGTAAGWLYLRVIALISDTTSPNLFQKSFLARYQQIVALAAVLTVGVVAMAVIEGGRRGDVGQLVGMLAGALPLAAFGMIVGLAIIQLTLNLVDTLSTGVVKATSSDIERWFEAGADWMVKGTTTETVAAAASGDPARTAESAAAKATPGFVLFVSALLGVIGAFGLWLELLLRDAAIYVCSLFLPLGLAAAVWPRWSGVLRKTFEILIVLVISKFFIVMVISLAASFLGKPDGVESVLAGSAMMIVALLMPLMLMKVIPFMEGALLTSGAAGMGRSAVSTASQVAMMRFHMGALAGHGAGRAAASTSASGGGPVPPPGGTPGGTATSGGESTGAGQSGVAGAGMAAASTSQARASGAAAQPVSSSAPVGQAATPRPVSVGDQQEQSTPTTAPDSTPPATSPTPRPARSPARRESRPSESEAPWQPSTAPDPKPQPGNTISDPGREGGGEADRPPTPEPPRPRRMTDG